MTGQVFRRPQQHPVIVDNHRRRILRESGDHIPDLSELFLTRHGNDGDYAHIGGFRRFHDSIFIIFHDIKEKIRTEIRSCPDR